VRNPNHQFFHKGLFHTNFGSHVFSPKNSDIAQPPFQTSSVQLDEAEGVAMAKQADNLNGPSTSGIRYNR